MFSRATFHDLKSVPENEYLSMCAKWNISPDTLETLSLDDFENMKGQGYNPTEIPFNIQNAVKACSANLNPEWGILASRISCRWTEYMCPATFSESIEMGKANIFPAAYDFIMEHRDELDVMIDLRRNDYFDYRGICKMMMYCNRSFQITPGEKKKMENIRYYENPQFTFLREALQLCLPFQCNGEIVSECHITRTTIGDDFGGTIGERRSSILEKVKQRYDDLSTFRYTQASPTIFNALKNRNNLSSCYLKSYEDNLQSIADGWKSNAILSSIGGGIGESLSKLRRGPINGGGWSEGIWPWVNVTASEAFAVDQKGTRKASIAQYLSITHVDVMKFLQFGLNDSMPEGYEGMRSRNLFYGLWMCDLFMKRVNGTDRMGNKYKATSRIMNNGMWTMFSPCQTPGLDEVYGQDFEDLYLYYEDQYQQGNLVDGTATQMKANDLYDTIVKTQIQTGMPYMLYGDACNRKSNQKNFGMVRTSNLCTEIIENTGLIQFKNQEPYNGIASCNLATINLVEHLTTTEVEVGDSSAADESPTTEEFIPKYQQLNIGNNVKFDFKKFEESIIRVTENLNNVIDRSYYPSEEGLPDLESLETYGLNSVRALNKRTRNIGIGVQGLANVCALMGFPFESNNAKNLSTAIFETLYFVSLRTSCELASVFGEYTYFDESPLSKGLLSPDLWTLEELELNLDYEKSQLLNADLVTEEYTDRVTNLRNDLSAFLENPGKPKWAVRYNKEDYDSLREICVKGSRNSLLISQPPTVSTSTIFGNNPSIEAFQPVIYSNNSIDGMFGIINYTFFKEFYNRGWWNGNVISTILESGGSVKNVTLEDCGAENTAQNQLILGKMKELFKHAYEMSQKTILDISTERNPFIDQSTSHNVFFTAGNIRKKVRALHKYSWKCGAKTGQYYLKQLLETDREKNHITSSLRSTTSSQTISDEEHQTLNDRLAQMSSPFLQRLGKDECEGCSS